MAAPRQTFPPVITATEWASTWSTAWNRALARRGQDHDASGTVAPKMTNAEAVQLIRAWTAAAGKTKLPLWYQFAAVAYGWDPPDNDALDTSAKQSDALYPSDINVALWLELYAVALALDNDHVTNDPPRLAFDARWDDATYLDGLRQQLQSDGARAAFKIPLPACKDPKTGKPTGRPHRNPKTGKWECQPVTVDDPITHVGKSIGSTVLILGLVWLLVTDDHNPRRRRRT